MVHHGQTYELMVCFVECTATQAAATKRETLAWLAQQGVHNIVESVCDGIHEPLAEDALGAVLFDESRDHLPLAIYDVDRSRLIDLEAQLNDIFTEEKLAFRLVALADEAWAEAWNEAAGPIVTRRFFVHKATQPPTVPPPPEQMAIAILDGEAFGDGRHATTQVALEVIEALPDTLFSGRCLDVGTGSGILGIAAALLGCRDVSGTDIDAPILAEAKANGARNGVTMRLMLTDQLPADGPYQIIAANILAPVLHQLMPALAVHLAAEGALILAGFIDKEAQPIITLASQLGLELKERRERRGWVGLWLSRR